MPDITVPAGSNAAILQALDANGVDVTGSCTLTAVAAAPRMIRIGTPDPTIPEVFPFVANYTSASLAGSNVTFTATNSEGVTATQIDHIRVTNTVPPLMLIHRPIRKIRSFARRLRRRTRG